MKGKRSYIDLAQKDLQAAGEMLRAGLYNHAARLCQQYIEKVFKECVHAKGDTELDLLLLHTHKLSRLATRCAELSGVRFGKLEMALFRELTDYYFDTNYPGENYTEVTEAEAKEAMEQTIAFQAAYENALCQPNIGGDHATI